MEELTALVGRDQVIPASDLTRGQRLHLVSLRRRGGRVIGVGFGRGPPGDDTTRGLVVDRVRLARPPSASPVALVPALQLDKVAAELPLEASMTAHVVAPETTLRRELHQAPVQELIGAQLARLTDTRAAPEIDGAVVVREEPGREDTTAGIPNAQGEEQIGLLEMMNQKPGVFAQVGWCEALVFHERGILVVELVGNRRIVRVLDRESVLESLADTVARRRAQRVPHPVWIVRRERDFIRPAAYSLEAAGLHDAVAERARLQLRHRKVFTLGEIVQCTHNAERVGIAVHDRAHVIGAPTLERAPQKEE